MDGMDRQLVSALRENGRASWAELGRLVGHVRPQRAGAGAPARGAAG